MPTARVICLLLVCATIPLLAQTPSAAHPDPVTAETTTRPPADNPADNPLPDPGRPPFLGVMSRTIPLEVRAQLELPPGFGLLVDQVFPDSPAAKAGIETYDVLIAFNDQQLTNSDQLLALIHRAGIHSEARIDFLRRGKPQKITCQLEPQPDQPFILTGNTGSSIPATQRRRQLIADSNLMPPPALTQTTPQAPLPTATALPQRIIRRDASGEYFLTIEDGHTYFTAAPHSSPGGRWQVDTAEQRQKIPQLHREKLSLMNPQWKDES
jgi:hypothetical protein